METGNTGTVEASFTSKIEEQWMPVLGAQVHRESEGQCLGHRYTGKVEASAWDTGTQGKWRPVLGTQVHRESGGQCLGHRYTGKVKVSFWDKDNRVIVEASSLETGNTRTVKASFKSK